MNPLLKKAKMVFDGAPVDIAHQCSITGQLCEHHTEECDYRVTCVISKIKMKVVGWFEGDHIIKTNPKPSKRYLKRTFGIKKEKKRARHKLFDKTDRTNPDRDEERTRRNQRRTEKDKRG